MFTLYDLLEIVGNEGKLSKFLLKYNIQRDIERECPKCGAHMRPAQHRGKPGMMCSSKACRKRISDASTGLLEGAKDLFILLCEHIRDGYFQ